MKLYSRTYIYLILFFIFISVNRANGKLINFSSQNYNIFHELNCTSNTDYDSWIIKFVNGCYLDTSKEGIGIKLGILIDSWFNLSSYYLIIISVLILLPFVAFTEDVELITQAKANQWRFQLVLLIFRIAFAESFTIWLQVLFQQERPCSCTICFDDNNENDDEIFGSQFGMPSIDATVVTLIGFYFIQYINFLSGLTLVSLVSFKCVILGLSNVGQIIAGFSIGLILHIYQIGSPICFRVVDIFVNLIFGSIAIYFIEHDFESTNFNFTINFLRGIAWQLFSLVLFIIYFKPSLVKVIFKKPSHFVKYESFIYYTANDNLEVGSNVFSPQRRFETLLFLFSLMCLFLAQWGLNILSPHVTDILNSF